MTSFLEKIKKSGPAAIITSTFVGPGTVIVATKTGALEGYNLLWAVLFSVASLIILMEMTARITLAGKKDLIHGSITVFPNSKLWKYFVYLLVLIVCFCCCFAFQAGNLTGGSIGLSNITGLNRTWVVMFMAVLVLIVTLKKSNKVLELLMKTFVLFMGIVFVIGFFAVKPDFVEVAKGFIPNTKASYGLTLAMIGTTVVGINIILYSIINKDKYTEISDLKEARFDIVFNVIIGGIITIAIVGTSAAIIYGKVINGNPALAFTSALKESLGSLGSITGNLGLFCAGLSSAIAIPLIIKKVTYSIFKFKSGVEGPITNILGVLAIAFGSYFAIFGQNPTQIIILAQTVSGLFLPIITLLILLVANNKSLLGDYTNNKIQNVLGLLIFILTLVLSYNGVSSALAKLFG